MNSPIIDEYSKNMKKIIYTIQCCFIVLLFANCDLEVGTLSTGRQPLIGFQSASYVNLNTFKIRYKLKEQENIESYLSDIQVIGKVPYTIDEVISNESVSDFDNTYEITMTVKPAFVSGDSVTVKISKASSYWSDSFFAP